MLAYSIRELVRSLCRDIFIDRIVASQTGEWREHWWQSGGVQCPSWWVPCSLIAAVIGAIRKIKADITPWIIGGCLCRGRQWPEALQQRQSKHAADAGDKCSAIMKVISHGVAPLCMPN